MSKKSKKAIMMIYFFLLSFIIGFFFSELIHDKSQELLDPTFLISKENCEKLNTFREHIGRSYDYELISTEENMIDFRSEKKIIS